MIDDGVIKYNCIWEKTPCLSSDHLRQLISWRNKARSHGYIGVYASNVAFGNISERVSQGFIISSSNTGQVEKADNRHFSLVYRWNIEQNKLWCKGPMKASSESLTHAIIYESLPQVHAILHIHHPLLWKKYFSILPSTASQIEYGTPTMARAVQKLLKSTCIDTFISDNPFQTTDAGKLKNIFLMQGHTDGLVSFGTSLEDCFQVFGQLERCK